ncbi:TlpA family protein disulfide reductase [Muricauda oceani]|uniref:TlpA family protein disulfide reductase n=1 Tax=Flagellimonas oceani TaxID=2698672 RepID=A0A6G7J1G6_9FLAO|nr:TlpA disulfide reductase family protein [Allomuricauda oceani]MBW8241296.1 TlpA family protein disulfide reductase [Allomuricauda oceani]QII44703.1 TlpA family protein disulfide reductase [Allomuricauda oceani]
MRHLLKLTLFFLLLMQSCSEKPWLSGTINLDDGEDWKPMVYLIGPEKLNDVAQSFVGKVLDSAQVAQNGHFEFKDQPEFQNPVLLELAVQQKGEKYSNRLLNENPETDNYFPLVYEPGTEITIEAEIARFQSTFSIQEPSPENAALLQVRDLRLKAYGKHLENEKDVHGADKDLLEREKNQFNFKRELINFADRSEELLPALVALRWASPEGNYERVAEMLYDQSVKWNGLFPQHPWVIELASMAKKENLPVLVGDVVADIELPSKEGKTILLHTLLTGQKLVVLDVWASWCAPCRMENRDVLVPLWEKYNTDGFQIVAYGLESSETAWHNAIERDGAYRWPHFSHLEGDQNPLMDAFRLKTIPANFLLNEEGRVLAKNLHGEELTKFVDNYMVGK